MIGLANIVRIRIYRPILSESEFAGFTEFPELCVIPILKILRILRILRILIQTPWNPDSDILES